MTAKIDARMVNVGSSLSTTGGQLNVVAPSPFTQFFTQTVAYGGPGVGILANHTLGAKPKLFKVWFECVIAEQGYSVGDRVDVTSLCNWFSTDERGMYNWVTSTQVFWKTLTNNPVIVNKSTGVAVNTTTAKWQVVFEAWA